MSELSAEELDRLADAMEAHKCSDGGCFDENWKLFTGAGFDYSLRPYGIAAARRLAQSLRDIEAQQATIDTLRKALESRSIQLHTAYRIRGQIDHPDVHDGRWEDCGDQFCPTDRQALQESRGQTGRNADE